MSRMKNYAEKVSKVLGFEGEINPEVLAVGSSLQNLAEQYGLVISVGEQSLTLHHKPESTAHDPTAANEDGDALFRRPHR